MEYGLAKKEDVSTVLTYIRKLADYESRSDEVKVDEETLKKAMFEDHLGEVMFMMEDDRIIGYCFFYTIFSSFSGKKKIYLEDLYIDEGYRGKGRGRDFLKHMAKLGIERGCQAMAWGSQNWNIPAVSLYLKIGAETENGRTHFELSQVGMIKLINE